MLCVTAPHFTAAVILDDEQVVALVAPILHYMRGWTLARVLDYAHQRGWSCTPV